MKNGTWISIVITKPMILVTLLIIGVVLAGVSFGTAYDRIQRRFQGVKQGVSLAGHTVAGLLHEELYDAISSIAEEHVTEARNASYDWQSEQVNPEQVGRVIDVKSTVELVRKASTGEKVEFVIVEVLPSITQAHFTPYYRGPSIDRKVSLMVNVDWGDQFIPSMLETFREYDVTTTWFPTGRWVSNSPEMAKRIADAGHEVGNHGGWHGMASKMGADEVRKLILDGEERIQAITGQKPRIFAPPAGDMNKQTVAIAGELGYKTILWTVDTIDWQRPAATVIIDRILSRVGNGALVLMHPTKPTAEALPHIIKELQSKEYAIVTVSELLGDEI